LYRIRWTRCMPLSRLKSLDAETAQALAGYANGPVLHTGLTAIDAANALATRTGNLALPNLEKISPKTIAALIENRDVKIPRIDTLELIQEPDGSGTEDFVIPEDLRQPLQAVEQVCPRRMRGMPTGQTLGVSTGRPRGQGP